MIQAKMAVLALACMVVLFAITPNGFAQPTYQVLQGTAPSTGTSGTKNGNEMPVGDFASVAVTISGTFSSGTVVFEGSTDHFVNVTTAILATKVADGTQTTSPTVVGTWSVPCAGFLQVRARFASVTGTVLVTGRPSVYTLGKGSGGGSGAPADATFITQTPNATLTNEQALSALSTGLVKNTTTTGVLSIAGASDLPSAIDAAKIANGSVSSTEFQYLDGVTSAIQTQLNARITGILTPGTILVATGVNAVGDSGITDDGSQLSFNRANLTFGTSDVTASFSNTPQTIGFLAGSTGLNIDGTAQTVTIVASSGAVLPTITTGIWHGTVIDGLYGGTGVANSGKTITLGGNLVTSGAFATTITSTATTNSTLPAGTHSLAPLDSPSFTGTVGISGATTTGPDVEVSITGDTFARVAMGINTTDVARIGFGPGNAARDTFLERAGVATLRHGGPDAAAPVAQIESMQNVVAGTSNTAGANYTLKMGQGTGTGIGGSYIVQVAPAGSTGTSQNALANALVIDSTKLVAIPGSLSIGAGAAITNSGAGGALGTGAFAAAGATTTLNNLGTTSINADLLPASTQNLGSTALPWATQVFGSTTQYGTWGATAGSLNLVAAGSATNIGVTVTPKGAGGLGIGAAASLAKLEITGGIGYLGGNTLVTARFAATPTNNRIAVIFDNLTAGSSASSLFILQKGGTEKWSYGNDSENNGTQSFFVFDSVAAKNRLYISSGGNLNIGSGGVLGISSTTDAGGTLDSSLSRISAGLFGVGTGAAGSFAGNLKLTDIVQVGKITTYNNVATAGIGVPAIVAAGRVTAQSAANASISTYTVGAADSSFDVSMNMNVTAATVLSTSLNCDYTDESNTARTMILPTTSVSGTFLSGGLVTGAGAFETPAMHIRCRAGTAITLYTAAGTFTSTTYTAEGNIKQTK